MGITIEQYIDPVTTLLLLSAGHSWRYLLTRSRSKYSLTNARGHSNHYFLKGDIKRDKAIIQYARKPGLAHNQRWKYQDGFIASAASPHLVLDIRASISLFIPFHTSIMI